jgi:nucleoside-diphosphate-sugar epimerase
MASDVARSKTVLVTGAAGGMGLRLVSRLLEAGWRVRGLVLPGDPLRRRLEWLGSEVVEADIRDARSLDGACDGVDAVYHLAAVILSNDPSVFRRVNRDGTAHVVRAAARAGVKHLVYISSASVVYPNPTPYSQSKRDAEAIVAAERAFAHTIVRPTLVYDENGGLELSMFERYLMRFPIVPFIGDGAALKRPVLSHDLVDGLVRLAGNEIAFGKIYNLSGGEAISIGDFARLILEHRGVAKPFVHVPVPLCKAMAQVMQLTMKKPPFTLSAIAGLTQDADLDPGSAMRDLGYRPIGVREGFRRCFPVQSRTATTDRHLRTRSQDDAAPNP